MERLFAVLLVLTPLAALAEFFRLPPVAVFLIAAAALIPLAKYIGDATEELAGHTSPAVGGLLNATFGNATELLVGIFALNAGLVGVVKASITGSILGNLLLVLGTAMLAGGWNRREQKFNATGAKAQGSQLLLATIALVIPAVFILTTGDGYSGAEERLSIFVAVLMILAYLANLYFTLHTHKHLYQEEAKFAAPTWSITKSVIILFFATAGAALVSEILVNAIRPLIAEVGWTELFIGVVIVAIVGNAAEHFSAVRVAMRDRMDLALQISIGSATQIVMFIAPVLVLASLFFATPMNLVFNLFELAAIIFTVFVTNAVVEDGESNWLEGTQLLVAYVIIAVAFFFHP